MENEEKSMRLLIAPSMQGGMWWIMMAVFISLALFLVVSAKNSFYYADYPSRTISVSAEEKRVVRPDIGLISFTIREENASLEVARNAEAKKSEALIAFLKKSGIEDRDIKTTSYTIYPSEEYDYSPCESTDGSSVICPPRKGIKKFVIEEAVAIKVRKLDDIGKITTGATKAGVNQIGQLRFTVDDEVVEKLKAEARESAITKARAEAKTLAGNLGVRLGKLAGFSENGGMPVYYGRAMGMGGDMMEKSMVAPAPSIQPGENEIIASVNLIYEIK